MGKKQGPYLLANTVVKAKPPAKKTVTKSKRRTGAAPAKKKRVPLPGGASFPSFQLPNPKSPTFYDDSVRTMTNLRKICKQCVGYMQKADQWIDNLHGFGSHLHKAGVLPKLSKGNFKDLSMDEWGSLLMALMNSPFSGLLLGSPAEEAKEKDNEQDTQ